MKRLLLCIILLTIFGVQACSNKSEQTSNASKYNSASGECTEKPQVILTSKNVQEVALSNQMISQSGIASKSKSIGYTFKAQEGQKLTYQTKEDLCVWIYSPDNELLNSTVLPKTGKYVIQVTAPKGSTTFELAIGLDVSQSPPTSTDSSSANSSATSSTPSSSSTTSSSPLSQEEAVNLVKSWQQAKRKIFASPFDSNLGSELLIGEAYGKNIGNSDSSMNWLQRNNAYYTYGLQQVDRVKNFIASGNQATIEVVTTEQRTLCLNGRPSRDDNTISDTSLVRYNLQVDGGKWKISDYDSLEQIRKTYNPNPSC